MTNEEVIQKNKELIERYPFLLPRNRFTDKIPEDYDYTWTELDALPDGWRIAFGEQLCEEISEELIEHNLLDQYRIMQIKEKFGFLHWYCRGATKKIHDEIIPKYERLSERTCIHCGKPATKISTGWVSPWCEACSAQIHDTFVSVDEWFKEDKSCDF